MSGLSPATVTRNVAYLMTVGVLAEDTTRVRTEGRSRIPVTVNAAYGRIAIVGLTYRGATLYQYDMALEPCANPSCLGETLPRRTSLARLRRTSRAQTASSRRPCGQWASSAAMRPGAPSTD